MLLRFLPIFMSLGYKIDLYLLYDFRLNIKFESYLGCNYDQINIFSIFPYKTDDYKRLMKEDPHKVYYSAIHDTYDIEIAFQDSYSTKLSSTSTNEKSKKIVMTDKGQVLIEQKMKPLVDMEDRVLASWTEEDRRKYLELIEKFKVQFEKEVKAYDKRK